MKELFAGVATALITPFRDGTVDFGALGRLLDRQTEAGIPAVVIAGTTGESPALTYEEFGEIMRFSRTRYEKILIAGCGANCTARAVELAKIAAEAGADALLAVTPYYNKASRAGLLEHYRAICGVGKPVIVYHVPTRTGLRLSLADFSALAGLEGVCGVKECSGDPLLLRELAVRFRDRWTVWTGNDDNLPAAVKRGARGVISVVSNLLPEKTAAWCAAALDGDTVRENALSSALSEKIASLFWEVNPIPVKYVAAKMGLCQPEYRLPMTPPDPATARRLETLWRDEISRAT